MIGNKYAKCKACDGAGVQTSDVTGLKVRCPECGGEGNWPRVRNDYDAKGVGWPHVNNAYEGLLPASYFKS